MERHLRFANLLHGDVLNFSDDMGDMRDCHRLVAALDHAPLLPSLLLDGLWEGRCPFQVFGRCMRRSNFALRPVSKPITSLSSARDSTNPRSICLDLNPVKRDCFHHF